jgi:amino acid transporter
LPRLGALSVTLLSLLAAIGCIRRDGRNSDCEWPKEIARNAADARHLSADAEFAEDLAIRYADAHHGLRTPNYVSREAYAAARDRCMHSLFGQIAKEHGVPVELVSGALGFNRARIDVAVNVPFVLLYCFAVATVARLLWRRYPPGEYGWIPGAIMALFLSLAIAGGGTMLGEMWSRTVESFRVGSGHMSYRLQRLWWVRHQTGLFASGVAIFWMAISATARRIRSI